jgi:hypothetical protein
LITLAGANGYSWGRNLIGHPEVFAAPRQDLIARVDQVVADHPDLLADARDKLRILLDRPHNAVDAGGDLLNALTAGAAGYLDAAWQQNPAVKWAGVQLRSAAGSCPNRLGEAWWRRCASLLYLGASLVENPADTSLGVANSLVIHPVEGAVEWLAFGVENNPVRMWGRVIRAARSDGLNGVVDTVGSFLHRFSAMTADPQAQSALWTTAFGLLLLVPGLAGAAAAGSWGLRAGALQQSVRLGLPAIVAVQAAEGAGQIDQAVQAAATREQAMRIPTSHSVRTFVTNTVLILSLLLGAPALRKLSEWQRLKNLLTPETQAALETLPLTERTALLEAAVRIKAGEAEIIRYVNLSTTLPETMRQGLEVFPWSKRLQLVTAESGSRINLSPAEAESFLVRSGFDPARAADFISSFPAEGPVQLRYVPADGSFLRYTDFPNRAGSFATDVLYSSADEAVNALNLRPYDNHANFLQTVIARGPTLVLEGGIRGGEEGAVQYLIIDQSSFRYGEGVPLR